MIVVESGAGVADRQKAVLPYRICTVAELIADLGIASSEVGLVLINKKAADLYTTVQDGDHISLLPVLCGG